MFRLILIVVEYIFAHLKLGIVMLEDVIPSLPVIPSLLLILMISVYTLGHVNAINSCESRYNKAIQKQGEKNDKIKQKIDGASVSALDKLLQPYYSD